MKTLPLPEKANRQAEYEVDEVLAEMPVELYAHLDAKTRRLIREVMVMSWQRGAAWVVEQISAKEGP